MEGGPRGGDGSEGGRKKHKSVGERGGEKEGREGERAVGERE